MYENRRQLCDKLFTASHTNCGGKFHTLNEFSTRTNKKYKYSLQKYYKNKKTNEKTIIHSIKPLNSKIYTKQKLKILNFKIHIR